MAPYTQSQLPNLRSRPHFPSRVLLIVISASFGTYSLFFIGPQVKALDRSVSLWSQIAGALVVAGAYAAVGFVATKDIRWSSIVAIVFTVVSTPLFALFWLMSGWSMPSAEAARPYLAYIAGNIVMFVAAVTILVKVASSRAWNNTR